MDQIEERLVLLIVLAANTPCCLVSKGNWKDAAKQASHDFIVHYVTTYMCAQVKTHLKQANTLISLIG